MLSPTHSAVPYSILRKNLMRWGKQNTRNYPWMGIGDPYKIWLSEIILQQTRVEQGLPYYLAFVKAYPTVGDLARADQDEVLLLWQGLGYYSRARNLLHTAREICSRYQGTFPASSGELKKLKGIGPYTAAAIASFAFGEPVAAIDGNAIRVLSRLFAIADPVDAPSARKQFEHLAEQLLDRKNPGLFNQAMMDLGSGICLPRNPLCNQCPLNGQCLAFRQQTPTAYPVKKQKIKRTARFFEFILLQSGDSLILEKRDHRSIWAGLYQFPVREWTEKPGDHRIPPDFVPEHAEWLSSSPWKKHLLTHLDLWYSVSEFRLKKLPKPLPPGWLVVKQHELSNFAFPKPLELYIKSIDYLHSRF